MQRVTLLPVLLVIALAGCSADAATDAPSLNYAMQANPFTGSCELVSQPPQPISPGVVRQVNVGDCIVSHLGKSTYISENVINFATGTQTFQGSYIAANGDLLYFNGNGTNQLVAPGQVAFEAEVTFQGGTGRFADATGSATVAGAADVISRTSQFATSGTIAY
jgi:hypothetical protein